MKTILITGSSSGIGLETAKIFLNNGYRVFATARKKSDVVKLSKMGFDSFVLDVTKTSTIDKAFCSINKITPNIDVVFNNAGYGQPGALEDVKIEVLKKQFNTNVFGAHYINIKSLELMRRQGFGKIIIHSSILGLISLRFRGAYNASKYALEGLTDTLRLELFGTNIKIITLNTGPVESMFRKNAIKSFFNNIDIENSTYKNQYQNRDYNEDSKKDIFTHTSQKSAKIIFKIATANNPKPRYYITKIALFLAILKRVLPTSLFDSIARKIE
jgi:short-subunit dehydrogenase